MKWLLVQLARILNTLPKTDWKPIPLCSVYGRYGLEAPNLVGHVNAPSVTTNTETALTQTSFTANGDITNTGGANATVRGFCWFVGTSGDPTIANNVVNQSGSFSTGAYSLGFSGLSPNTSYRVRAYATNSAGTGYGTTITVTTLPNQPPTVVLNSPANEAEVGSEPQLEFTGSDDESESIRYEVEIGSFTLSGVSQITESTSVALTPSTSTSTVFNGQVVSLPACTVKSFSIKLSKNSTPTATIVGRIWEIGTGTYGTDARPNNTPVVLATSINSFSEADVAVSLTTLTFNFNDVDLPEGNYCFGVEIIHTFGSTGSWFANRYSSGDTYSGNRFTSVNSGSTWSTFTNDLFFEVDYLLLGSELSAVSGTDPGFQNLDTPADTDPFNSGDRIRYTVQSPLDEGTYYWRVRGRDPSGSDTWGAWSAVREFTVAGGSGPSPLVAVTASFTLTGFSADLLRALTLVADVRTYSFTGIAATLSKERVLIADPGTFALTMVPADFLRSYQLLCDTGGFTLTGIASDVLFNRTVVAETGTFTLSGVTVSLGLSQTLNAGTGVFVLTGVDTAFARTYVLDAAPAAFSVTGVAVTFPRGLVINAEPGSFSLTGFAVSFPLENILTASVGTFTFTGIAGELQRGYVMVAEPASFTVSGIATIVAYNRLLDVTAGGFEVSTVSATFQRSYALLAAQGAFVLSGIDTDLLKNFAINADVGNFTWSGVPVILAKGIALDADPGAFALSGVTVTFQRGRVLDATRGIFELTGVANSLEYARIFTTDPGAFNLTGFAIELLQAQSFSVSVGTYTFTGNQADLIASRTLAVDPATFTLDGIDVSLQTTGNLNTNTGAFTVTGVSVELTKHFVINAEVGEFEVSGSSVTFEKVFILTPITSSYTFDGVPVSFQKQALINAEPAFFTGPDTTANFILARILTNETVEFLIEGTDVSLVFGIGFAADTGAYFLTYYPSDFVRLTPGISDPFCPAPSPFSVAASPFSAMPTITTIPPKDC